MPEESTGEITSTLEGSLMPLSEEILSQGFIARHTRIEQTAERFNDGSAFVAQESKQGFLLQKMLMGATAQNLLEKEGLADTLLQLKSSGVFPGNLPSGGNVAPDAIKGS